MKKNEIKKTPEQKHQRRYRFFQAGFFTLLLVLAATCYFNYDYWVFKLLIAGQYVFTDALDELYTETLGEQNVKGYYRDFDRIVMAAVTEKIRAVNQDRYTYLYTPQGYQYSKASEIADAKTAYIEVLSEETVLMYLPNISKLTRRFVYDNRETIKAYQNLVLDLRGNYGGLLADSYRIADLFTEKGVIVGYEQMRLSFLTHAVKSKNDAYFSFEQIVILQDGNTASASEGLIQALKKHVPNVTLMGETTFGKGIGQVTIPLTEGYAVRATILLVKGPDGGTIHRSGIMPDIRTDGEDMIEQALHFMDER